LNDLEQTERNTAEAIPASALAGLVATIAPDASLIRAWPLRGGISARMTALELRSADGETRRVILRQPGSWALAEDPRAAAREYGVLQTVRGVGIRAPAPLLLDETGTILPFPYLVVEFVDGQVEHSPAYTQTYVAEIAAELARIHRVDVTRPELASLPSRSDGLAHARAERPVARHVAAPPPQPAGAAARRPLARQHPVA
jgi:aminoglycoside phosphotransferase (APT) family kinase protein